MPGSAMPGSGSEAGYRVALVEDVVSDLNEFVRDGIVQRVGADVAPEPVESVFGVGSPGTDDLKDTAGHVQGRLGGYGFDSRYLHHEFAAFLRS